MKIALVVPGGVDRSGERRVIPALLALLKRLAAHHEVHVYALAQEPTPDRWMLQGASVHNIGGRAAMRVPRVLRAIRGEHARAPFDVVQSLWAGPPGFAAVCAGRLLSVPSAVHVAGGELVALPAVRYGGRRSVFGRMVQGLTLRGASVVTAASQPILRQIESRGRKGRRIALGVDLNEWPMRLPVERDTRETLRIIHVASLNAVKDQGTLLAAVAKLAQVTREFHLDVVGEDTLGGRIQARALELGLGEQVTFHGFLTQRELRPLLEQAHVNVISSLHEAGPLAVLEAAVAGVPTVGTCVGHIEEWAPAAALAVPVADDTKLAAALECVRNDEPLRMRLAREAQRRAICEDADYTGREFLHLYAELVG